MPQAFRADPRHFVHNPGIVCTPLQILAAVAVENKELCFLPGCDPGIVVSTTSAHMSLCTNPPRTGGHVRGHHHPAAIA